MEYGGFFSNPELYAKVRDSESDHQVAVEDFVATAKELRKKGERERAEKQARDAAATSDLEIVVPEDHSENKP